jgi:GNAT superfamily N-acetyltransferase
VARRQSVRSDLCKFRVLSERDAEAVTAFSCGNADLDDFLRSDALRYQAHHVATTYLGIYEDRTVGYVTLMADAVILSSRERKQLRAPNSTPLGYDDHPVIPALKVARLGACQEFRTDFSGCGHALVRFACWQALMASRSFGCRLVTVDAYPEAIEFYERIGFARNRAKPYKDRERPSMRFDLFAPEVQDWLYATR